MRSSRHHNGYTPFAYLSRSKRADKVIALKNRVRKDVQDYGGMFTSDLVLNEPGRPHEYSQWFDVYFPGVDRFTLWNGSIITATKQFWEKVSDLAYERVSERLTAEQIERESAFEFEPASWSSTGKVTSYTMVDRDVRYDVFEGRTFSEEQRRVESQIAESEQVDVFESFEIVRSYRYGIGLHVVVDVPYIDRKAIEDVIERFRAGGEQAWTSPTPVPEKHLPMRSEWDTYMDLKKRLEAEKETVGPPAS